MALQVTARTVATGVRGAAYLNGVRWGEVRKWRLYRTATRSSELVIGQGQAQSVPQSFAYHLTVSKLLITDDLARRVLQADQDGVDLEFRFIGERRTNDGRMSRAVVDGVVISGDMDISSLEAGTTATDDLTFEVNGVPSFDQSI